MFLSFQIRFAADENQITIKNKINTADNQKRETRWFLDISIVYYYIEESIKQLSWKKSKTLNSCLIKKNIYQTFNLDIKITKSIILTWPSNSIRCTCNVWFFYRAKYLNMTSCCEY